MQATRTRPALRRGGIVYLSTEDIVPNPVQPRKLFDDEGLEELSRSIQDYGILNPLSVRLRGSRYELVAGERRLRAARLAGLKEVPCILLDVNMEDASLIALVENLQRRDLDFIEEANGIKIPYEIKPRRAGDIATCYCDPSKAKKELGWEAQYGIREMCADSWRWQKNNPNGYES